MNIGSLMKLKQAWDTFKENHPKFPAFLNAVSTRGIQEGTVLEVTVKYADGTHIKTNIAVKPEDVDLLQTLQNLRQ